MSTALAAELYGLATLAAGVVDEPNARTRFVLAGLPGPPPQRTGADRTSVVLRLDNVPGALVSAMTEFAIRDIDLTRIESRPTRTELGTYVFFLDCVGHIDDDSGRRGTQGAAPALCRREISGFLADGCPPRARYPPDDRRGIGAGWPDSGRAVAMTGRLVLVRHGQSHGNVDRRLDTRPPGAALTDLGHEQARDVRP